MNESANYFIQRFFLQQHIKAKFSSKKLDLLHLLTERPSQFLPGFLRSIFTFTTLGQVTAMSHFDPLL